LKCISLKQPYAEMLASGKKTIEIRKWNTNFRGPFLIPASKNVNMAACSNLGFDENKLGKSHVNNKIYPSVN
jgi:hypothetical protein